MAQIFRHPPQFEPAPVPPQPRSRRRHGQNARQQQQLHPGKGPFDVAHPGREIQHAHHHRERGEQEIDAHSAAIGIGKAAGDTVGKGKRRQHIFCQPRRHARVTAGHGPSSRHHSRGTATGNRAGRFVIDPERGKPPARSPEHPFDPAVQPESPAAGRPPHLPRQERRVPAIDHNSGADDRFEPGEIGRLRAGRPLPQFFGPGQDPPGIGRGGIDQQHRRAHRQRGNHRMPGPARQIGHRPVPHRDHQIGPFDHHPPGQRDIIRHQRFERAGGGAVGGVGQRCQPQRLNLRVTVGEFEELRPASDRADRGGAGFGCRIAGRRARQQGGGRVNRCRMGVDRKVQRRTKRQRHRQFPPARQRKVCGNLIGPIDQQAVEPHRPAWPRQAVRNRIGAIKHRRQRG